MNLTTKRECHQLDDYFNKCRCCFKKFEIEDGDIKITSFIEKRFEDLTNLKLIDAKERFSNKICETCNYELKKYSSFKNNLTLKQLKLYEVFGISSDKTLVKIEPKIDPLILLDPSEYLISIEENDLEIKEEHLVEEDQDLEAQNYNETKQETFPAKTSKRHNNRKTQQKRIREQCPDCGVMVCDLKNHQKSVHLKIRYYFCDLCQYAGYTKNLMRKHAETHLPKSQRQQFPCSICNIILLSSENLKHHIRSTHEEKGKFECEICGKLFSYRKTRLAHIRRIHNKELNRMCKICNKAFFNGADLKKHIKSHGEKELLCEICAKSFWGVENLKMHLVLHEEPAFRCDFEGCDKKCYSVALLRSHQKRHNNQKDYQCPHCAKKYYSSSHVNRHILESHQTFSET